MSELQKKLKDSLTSFLNSPYRGEWNQIAQKLTAGELRLLVAHLTLHPLNEEDLTKRLKNFGTIEVAELF